jgi:hypothetical protein
MPLSLRFPGALKLILTNKEYAVSSNKNMLTNKGWIFFIASQFHKLKAHLSEMSHLEHESLIWSKMWVPTFVVSHCTCNTKGRLKPYISHTQKSADMQTPTASHQLEDSASYCILTLSQWNLKPMYSRNYIDSNLHLFETKHLQQSKGILQHILVCIKFLSSLYNHSFTSSIQNNNQDTKIYLVSVNRRPLPKVLFFLWICTTTWWWPYKSSKTFSKFEYMIVICCVTWTL